jgi:hypothetical protein
MRVETTTDSDLSRRLAGRNGTKPTGFCEVHYRNRYKTRCCCLRLLAMTPHKQDMTKGLVDKLLIDHPCLSKMSLWLLSEKLPRLGTYGR